MCRNQTRPGSLVLFSRNQTLLQRPMQHRISDLQCIMHTDLTSVQCSMVQHTNELIFDSTRHHNQDMKRWGIMKLLLKTLLQRPFQDTFFSHAASISDFFLMQCHACKLSIVSKPRKLDFRSNCTMVPAFFTSTNSLTRANSASAAFS